MFIYNYKRGSASYNFTSLSIVRCVQKDVLILWLVTRGIFAWANLLDRLLKYGKAKVRHRSA